MSMEARDKRPAGTAVGADADVEPSPAPGATADYLPAASLRPGLDLASRALAGVFLVGPAFALIWLAAAAPPQANRLGIAAVAGIALLFGVFLRMGSPERFRARNLQIAVGLGGILVSAGVYFSASPNSGFAFFYLWAVPYAFCFFTGRQIAGHMALLGVSFAAALALQGHITLGEIAVRWIAVIATVLIVGVFMRQLAQVLAGSEKRLAEAQRIAHLGSWEWERETNRVVGSPELFHMLGVTPDADGVLREDVSTWVHPDDRARVQEAIRQAVLRGQPFSLEHRAVDGEGRTRFIHALGEPRLDARGRVVGMVGTNHDVTEAREATEAEARLRARLHQSERLESVGMLAGGIAHDFNNLLMVILSYAAVARREADGDDDRRRALVEIQRAAEKAAELVRQLLVFSRQDAPDPQSIDLGELLRETEGMLRGTIGDRVNLESRVQPGLWPVCADAGQIQQVLLNLAVNARDAMPGGGRLSIALENARITAQGGNGLPELPPGRYVRLTVCDTGVGVTDEVAARAFEPFFTTKPRGEGTGLGLASVYGIVTGAGGGVALDPGPGGGTLVSVYLPADGGAGN